MALSRTLFDARRYRIGEFLRRLWTKVQEDDVFFMAGAVAFNLLVAALPLLLLGVGISGYILAAQVEDPVEAIVALVSGVMPGSSGGVDVADLVRAVVTGVLEQRSGFTLFGALLFAWFATRLVGTLRVALREIFDIGQDRGILMGKLFDILVVVVGAVLIALNLGLTIRLGAALATGVGVLGVGGWVVEIAQRLLAHGLALLSIWSLFLVLYRYLPMRRIPWRTAMVAATFSGVLHEVLKVGFSWYATQVADYTSTWGNLATVGILLFWIYYEAVVFILGGEVAQVYTMRKAGRVRVFANSGGAS
ncbi:MAG TPA: YihY/virulence factor BrkB family protein [Longimicrobiales bacterium]|nr:YihY/virulence factor BrkB family protein [Longimicrobiales bacterium]